MPIFRWMWIQPSESGDAADDRVNTFHFSIPTPDITIYQAIASVIDEAWDTASSIFNENADFPNYRHKVYNLDDDEPRAPVYDELQTGIGTAPTGSQLPPELAVCLSFQGAAISGQPQARRRGRVYIGPLNSGAVEGGQVTPSYQLLVRDIGADILDASDAAADWNWVVFSPTNNTSVNVTNVWVDNAFDIQRRRGYKPTSRAVYAP